MIFNELPVSDTWLIDIEPIVDDRGFFGRAWCVREFAARGLVAKSAQTSLAYSQRAGTLRGIHFQAAPHEEAKLIRCVRGAAYVVALDLRTVSPTFLRWVAVELSAANRRSLYVPPSCAQGYQTLADDTEMFYQMSEAYVADAARGIRYNDPTFRINWPMAVTVISDADRCRPDYAFVRSSHSLKNACLTVAADPSRG
jgi:dTDP-4-dehydrorhamnose 3,5-epimerase